MTVTINGTTGIDTIKDGIVTSAKIVDGAVAAVDLDITVKPIGVGQSWTNVMTTPGRSLGTVYTNNSGRPIQVSVTVSSTGGTGCLVVVGGVTLANLQTNAATAGYISHCFVVPSGATYSLSNTGTVLFYWAELI